MKLTDILNQLSQVEANETLASKVESAYNTKLPKDVKKIISLHGETKFYNDFSLLRGLSLEEILDAPTDMAVDFVGKKFLPVFDLGDNDYIVFDLEEQAWYKFNIVDEVKFSKSLSLLGYFT